MDTKLALLKAFYRNLPKDRVKLETQEHGFDFLEKLLKEGIELEYGELTLSGLLHKYKLARVSERCFDALLSSHVQKACNVCLYFAESANDTLCFNLDNNSLTNNTAVTPEMEFAVRALRRQMKNLGCEPLIVASGRGYHAWVRLSEAVSNDRLYDFMLRVGVATMAALHAQGQDYHRIKLNFYPDPRTRNVVSLRLFGSLHAKNRVFSRVLASEELLGEESSWDYFSRYVADGTIPASRFESALASLVSHDPASSGASS